jgi:bifunctional non-homologous end joining protein LigD
MPLEEYARKRDFTRTPEPGPQGSPAKARQSAAPEAHFYIQRHDARRLHYDFRLEIGGTLKSWAVPKGPSLDPAVKALAVHVEDHPLDYGEFEGNIPPGNYGGGSVMLWDRGTFDLLDDGVDAERQIERGDLKFRLHGEKLNGDYAIVRMKGRGKGNEWLLIKKRDQHAVAGFDIEQYARSVKTGRTQEEIARDLGPLSVPDSPETAPGKTGRGRKATSPPAPTATFDPAAIPGAVKAPMPQAVAPMLAQLAERPPAGPNWVYEIKWDGVRALCFIDGASPLRMMSRNNNPCERQYPELSVLPHHVTARQAILDAEIAVTDEQGRSRFGLIQPRISVADANSIAHLARKTPATLFVFDLLYLDGYDLRGAPLRERRKALEVVLKPDSRRVHLSGQFATDGAEMLAAAREHGLEGIVAKQASSLYEPRRSSCWLKVKVTGEQEFVICGFTAGERAYFSSLVLGVFEGGKLSWVGNVGTGFDEKLLKQIHARLDPLVTDEMPFKTRPQIPRSTTWVKPELVCQVRFSEWTGDGKLRAPVFVALRDDKRPREVVRESAVDDLPGPPAQAKPKPGRSKRKSQNGAALLAPGVPEAVIDVEGRSLKFTNLNKIYYPRDGYTKRDILNYYDAVAPLILPHLAGRPLSLKRYPNGIDEDFFFQKNTPENYPDWLRLESVPSEHRGGSPINYIVCDDRATLLYLANLGCIDQNPWMSRAGSLASPDFVLIDLDPQEAPYDLIVEAALLVRAELEAVGLAGYPKTTGGDGMHIYIPLQPHYTYEQARQFAEILSILVLQRNKNLFTTPRSVSKRTKGKVYFDWMQISKSKTIAAPYVARAYDHAPVSAPLAWDEVRPGLSPRNFTIVNAPERFAAVGDLFAPVLKQPQKLEAALERLGRRLNGGA